MPKSRQNWHDIVTLVAWRLRKRKRKRWRWGSDVTLVLYCIHAAIDDIIVRTEHIIIIIMVQGTTILPEYSTVRTRVSTVVHVPV